MLWHLEDEGLFIVERVVTDRLETAQYPAVDSLVADEWALSDGNQCLVINDRDWFVRMKRIIRKHLQMSEKEKVPDICER